MFLPFSGACFLTACRKNTSRRLIAKGADSVRRSRKAHDVLNVLLQVLDDSRLMEGAHT